MVKLKLKYTYSPDLVRRIYVEHARESTGASIELTPAALSPTARRAALDAQILVKDSWPVEHNVPLDRATGMRSVADLGEFALVVPELADCEPNVTQAAADAERLLVALAARGLTLGEWWEEELARRAAAKLEREAAEAAKRQAQIEALRAQGIEALLARKDGQWVSTWYRDPHEQNKLARAAFGDNACGLSEAEAERRNAAELAERKAAEAAWIAEHAPELAERHAAGYLPSEELVTRAREVLFAPFAAWTRYVRLEAGDIRYTESCDPDAAKFDAEDATALTEQEYRDLRMARELSASCATVTAREHRGYCACRHCKLEDTLVTRRSLRVSVPWLGRTLSREYALPL